MKIAIAGYGLEGESSYNYFSSDSNNDITIVDERQPERELPSGIPTIIGDKAFEKLAGFDLVIRTAGLAINKIHTNGKIWSATNEFFAKCPAQIIGVTGTKGKGTTASLIASIFEASGRKVWLLGNIGTAALDNLKNIKSSDIVVYELSSFQLWDLESSPHVAVVLLIEPDHLNIHNDFNDYVSAKSNIRRHQTAADVCIYHPSNLYSKQIADSSDKGISYRYGVKGDGVYTNEGFFYVNEHRICSLSELQLIGAHNVENACAAISVAKQYGLSDKVIATGLRTFQGLPHRLELVREIEGVEYYNDSFSSSPSATIAAIKSFTQPEIIILGGIDKGADFSELATVVEGSDNVKTIIVIGEIRERLSRLLQKSHPDTRIEVTDLQTLPPIVELASSHAEAGDVVILSPGCASFDMFKNFYDRGDQFRSYVKSI